MIAMVYYISMFLKGYVILEVNTNQPNSLLGNQPILKFN